MNHQSTVDRAVADIRRSSAELFFRNDDRPSTEFVPVRRREDPEIRKAKAQARTAAWRMECDRQRRPESRDVGMALLIALVTSDHLRDMTSTELRFVGAALADLEARGFDREETKAVMRRLRNRLVDPGDRQGEDSETTGPAIAPSSWSTESSSPF
ncbi:MAG: hypothetical protein JWQ83_1155 [Lacunisphaera sp.]|nr:hypothetical protein [Lacunisphaera sp.]